MAALNSHIANHNLRSERSYNCKDYARVMAYIVLVGGIAASSVVMPAFLVAWVAKLGVIPWIANLLVIRLLPLLLMCSNVFSIHSYSWEFSCLIFGNPYERREFCIALKAYRSN